MAAGIHLPGSNETIDLQQQVARLQALLEASRQVHSTIREEAVLGAVLRIVVRELEMAGAAFPGTGLSYGEVPDPAAQTEEAPRFRSTFFRTRGQAHGRARRRSARRPRAHDLRVRLHRRPGPPGGSRPRKRPQPRAQHAVGSRSAGSRRRPEYPALAAARSHCRKFPATPSPSAPSPATKSAATTSTSSNSPTAACSWL